MEIVYPRRAAVDVHKRTAVASVGWADAAGRRHKQTRTFSIMTADLARLAAWLAEEGVTHVAIEWTGIFWKPVFHALEARRLTVVLANAAHVKAVPGRKTDVRDSEWLLDLLQHGLICGSFVPPAPIRSPRELTRYRTGLIEDRARQANRVQKVLEDANLKLAAVVTDVLGISGRRMLAALAAGSVSPAALADLATPRLRRKREALVQALTGQVQPYHRVLPRAVLDHIEYLDGLVARLDAEIEAASRPFAAAIELLCSIPGVKRRAAETIVAEIGVAMDTFPSAAQAACSSTGGSPGGAARSGRSWRWRTAC
jgi:transposase